MSEVVVLRRRLHSVGPTPSIEVLWWSGGIAMAVLDVGYDVERSWSRFPFAFSLSTKMHGKVDQSRSGSISSMLSPVFSQLCCGAV